MAAEPELSPFLADLLAAWRLGGGADAGVEISRADRGTNNHTFLVAKDGRRFVLRISQNLTTAQVRAEQQLLARLRQGELPFAVPEPVPAADAATVVETPGGPATLSRWLPGVRPDLGREAALERFGQATGLLGNALRRVPLTEAPQDWRGSAFPLPAEGADGDSLWRELRAAGVTADQTALLSGAVARVARAWAGVAGPFPVQVVHGDLAASNLLSDPVSGRITAVLDFEIAGADWRVQEPLVALHQSGALDAQRWQRPTAAFLRGYASAGRLTEAEVEVFPTLLLARSVGSALWRAGRWRRGQARLAEVTDRIARLETTAQWLAEHGAELVSLATAQLTGLD